MTNSSVVSTSQAAAILGVSPQSVGRMIRRGELDPVGKGPGLRGGYMLSRADVQRRADDQQRSALTANREESAAAPAP